MADKKFTVCGKSKYLEANCWKSHPDKAPEWYKDAQKGKEALSTSVDVVLVSVDVTNDGQDFGRVCL